MVHHVENGVVWISRGYSIYCGTEDSGSFDYAGSIPEKSWRRLISRTRLGNRIFRGGVLDLLPLSDGSLVATSRGTVYVRRPGHGEFIPTLRRPGRTWRLEALPDGMLYAGEYYSNPQREPVEILASSDKGITWQRAYLFTAGSIRHIHCIRYDHLREYLMVLTGDEDHEPIIMTTSDQFKTTKILIKGSQSARAVEIIPCRDGYWIGTDTQYEQNYAQFLTLDGKLTSRVPLSGSCLSASVSGDHIFFGTAAEPSTVNLDPTAKLYAFNGAAWTVLGSWRADRWSGTAPRRAALFQMARVKLPRCHSDSKSMFATSVAVRGADGHLHRWKF